MSELHDARNPRRVFEMAVFRLVNFRNLVRPEDVLRRIEDLERRLRGDAAHSGELVRKPGPGMPIEIAVVPPAPATRPFTPVAAPQPKPVPVEEPAPGQMPVPPELEQPAPVAIPVVAPEHRLAPVVRQDVQTVDGLALVQELASQQSGPNPFLARVLGEIVRAEIVGSLLVFWLLPRSRFHRSSIESSYAETILAFFTARLGVSLRLECRFTDEAVMPPRPAAPQVPEAVMPPRPAASQVPEAVMPPRPAAPQVPEAAMPPQPAAPQAPEAAMPPRPAAPALPR